MFIPGRLRLDISKNTKKISKYRELSKDIWEKDQVLININYIDLNV